MGNIYGGIVAAVIALPLAMAFGIASGLGAEAGIYGAICLGFFGSLFGGTKTQISGPTGPMTVVSASVVAQYSNNPALIVGVFLLAGLLQIVFGMSKIGKFMKFIPYPVISGFMTGIGIIIIVLQINVAFGAPIESSVIQTIVSLPKTLSNIDIVSLIFSTATLLIVILTPKSVDAKLPSPLIALFLLSFTAYIFKIEVAYVSDIPSGLPHFSMPELNQKTILFMINSAITLAILGAIDSLLTSIVADSMSNDKHDPNKELIGQGIGNSISALFGGLPGAGATMRTVVNIKSGATQKTSGMIHSAILLLVLLCFAPLASKIPMPVLAGILIKVGIDILDYKLLKQISIAPKYDLWVMLVVFCLTIFVDLIVAVGAGVVLASVLIIGRLIQKSNVAVTAYEEKGGQVENHPKEGLRIIQIDGPLFFASVSRMVENVEKNHDVKHVIIDFSKVLFMDLSAIYALIDSITKLKQMGNTAYIIADHKRKANFLKFGIQKLIPQEHIFPSQEHALRQIRALSFSKHFFRSTHFSTAASKDMMYFEKVI